MDEALSKTLDQMVETYSRGEFYSDLMSARAKYFERAGAIGQDDEDYEPRMQAFTNWYIFDYALDSGRRIVDHFINTNDVDATVASALQSVNRSLLEFQLFGLGKRPGVIDYVSGGKIKLHKSAKGFGLLPGDIFVGRTIECKGVHYLLNGVVTLPGSVKKELVKQASRVRKKKDRSLIDDFLFQSEYLMIRSKTYGHLDPTQVFQFA